MKDDAHSKISRAKCQRPISSKLAGVVHHLSSAKNPTSFSHLHITCGISLGVSALPTLLSVDLRCCGDFRLLCWLETRGVVIQSGTICLGSASNCNPAVRYPGVSPCDRITSHRHGSTAIASLLHATARGLKFPEPSSKRPRPRHSSCPLALTSICRVGTPQWGLLASTYISSLLRYESSTNMRAHQMTSQIPTASRNSRMVSSLKPWRQLHLLKAFKALSSGMYSMLSINCANAASRAHCPCLSLLSAVINPPAKALFSKPSRKSLFQETIISAQDSPQKSSCVGQRLTRSQSK